MKTDYYDNLGVDKDATQDEIKKAYRKKAKDHHPDASGDEDGRDEFERATKAYAVLSDPQKRDYYDKHGEEKPDEGVAPAVNAAVQLFKAAIAQNPFNLKESIAGVHAATLRKTESELERVRKQRSEIERQLGRIERAPANDFLSYALKEEIRAFDEQMGNIRSKIETMEAAVEILNEYVFTLEERPDETLYDTGLILNTFTGSAGTGGW